jgi:hypothetical protein
MKSLQETTLAGVKLACNSFRGVVHLEDFNETFEKEGLLELGHVDWKPGGESCFFLHLKDGIVPIYIGKKEKYFVLSDRGMEQNEFIGFSRYLASIQKNIQSLTNFLQQEHVPPWCSLDQFFLKIDFRSLIDVYEDVAPEQAFYAYSYPGKGTSGYVVFPFSDATYFCAYVYKTGEGRVYQNAKKKRFAFVKKHFSISN